MNNMAVARTFNLALLAVLSSRIMENMDDGKQPAILNEDLEGKHASYQEALQMAKDLHEQTRVS